MRDNPVTIHRTSRRSRPASATQLPTNNAPAAPVAGLSVGQKNRRINAMKHDQPGESDWKKFRMIVPELRERYLRKRNSEIIVILRDESSTPTNIFWTASERIEEIGRILRSCLDGHTRSTMMNYLMIMCRHQMLTEEDLGGFSEEVRGRCTEIQKEIAQQDADGKPPEAAQSPHELAPNTRLP